MPSYFGRGTTGKNPQRTSEPRSLLRPLPVGSRFAAGCRPRWRACNRLNETMMSDNVSRGAKYHDVANAGNYAGADYHLFRDPAHVFAGIVITGIKG